MASAHLGPTRTDWKVILAYLSCSFTAALHLAILSHLKDFFSHVLIILKGVSIFEFFFKGLEI